jgi:hypothetical protein
MLEVLQQIGALPTPGERLSTFPVSIRSFASVLSGIGRRWRPYLNQVLVTAARGALPVRL